MPIGFPSDPGAGSLKMTNKKFYRIAGGSTQKKGVVPDIILPSLLDAFELGETTLPYYLEYDTIAPANYESARSDSRLTCPTCAPTRRRGLRLRRTSTISARTSPTTKNRCTDKSVSLNEAVRLKEQADQKALKV